jgi:hypothetical protein
LLREGKLDAPNEEHGKHDQPILLLEILTKKGDMTDDDLFGVN